MIFSPNTDQCNIVDDNDIFYVDKNALLYNYHCIQCFVTYLLRCIAGSGVLYLL